MDLFNNNRLKSYSSQLDEMRSSVEDKDIELASLKKDLEDRTRALEIIGYSIHHLGQDIASINRSDSVLEAEQEIQKNNGLAMAQIGSLLRSISDISRRSDKLKIKTLAKMFGETIDNKCLPDDDNFKELKRVSNK